ncbi:general substrate transporter [Corynespora cassiicola Philippines]|uniref:General substrate transporter n=1 Tax=Corynespora cassiicola Philippines TaxID=1448308 RepID=A0A2T2P9Y0_CORCC|nr:general substrate transporter [Corynespora cassiicola Philippines]
MGKPSLLKATKDAIQACPREIFNWHLFFCTAVWSFSGVAKGFDEGNVASIVVMSVFKKRFRVDHLSDEEYADTKGWIVSIATAGAVFGCLACVNLVQRLGRKNTMLLFTAVYVAGIFGQTFTGGSLSGLYASRFISGIGIGTTTVLPSIYITEIAPKSIRGLLTLQYACCQQLGVVFGFFFNYGITRYHAGTQLQWQLPTGLQIIPAIMWGIGIYFTPESPRFLLSKNRPTEAMEVLVGFRKLPADHPYVQEEFQGINQQLNMEIEAVSGATTWDLFKETFTVTEYRRRFLLMFFCHLFGQWSGANGITQYSPSIFGYLGIVGEEARFLATGLYAIVKFVSVLVFSIFVIDFIGRRRSLMVGISLQIVTLTFVGAYLGVTNGMSAEQIEASASATAASKASIVAIFFHAIAWSIGWFSIPYLVSAEVFPIRIRSLNVSILMAFHWAFYFGCSKAMPSLLAATKRYGAFVFFASMCSISLVYVFFALPETAGRSLESMDKLFERPWYTVHKVAYPTASDLGGSQDIEEKIVEDMDQKNTDIRIEQESTRSSARH